MPPKAAHRSALRPSLPQNLLEQIDESTDNARVRQRKLGRGSSRKETRKQERLGRKQRKAEFFSAAPPGRVKRVAETEHADSPKRKKVKATIEPLPAEKAPLVRAADNKAKTASQKTSQPPVNPKAKPKSKTALERLAARAGPSLNPTLKAPARSQREIEEDSYIAYLESKLGYKGRKQKSSEDDDGLDDLLDFTTTIAVPQQEKVETTVHSEEESIAISSDREDDNSVEDDVEDDEKETEEWNGIQRSSENEDSASEEPVSETSENKPEANTTRYIPPHLRNRTDNGDERDSEAVVKLSRQLKGLLNRMSEQNIASILDSIEEMYRKHRRHDVTSTLTTLIVDGISSHSSLLDSYVVLYAAFVSSLHKIVGIEFAAYFVQNVISSYERHRSALLDDATVDAGGKECSNLIVLVSELYNFQVISCVLVFDIIRGLLAKKLSEFDVELLLKIVRNSGQQLRQDDPSALKDIIQIVQSKVSGEDSILSSRTRFMIETLTNLKNNKIKRNTTQNQGGEAVERMKKFLSGLSKKRHVLAHDPLRVSLEDLHSAESKGKWWLVGAAWGGDPLLDRQEGNKQDNKGIVDDVNDNTLLKLARKQGMNTDIRRSIFVVLMSSDDYVDACERLSQLNLKEVQQREIVRVILHCCGNEKSYNPYYTLVCQHLCKTSHSYKITLQFCLWDFLRDLGETNVGGAEVIKNLKEDDGYGFDVKSISSTRMKNVAKAYAWWLAKDCSTLAILKPVDFTVLKPQTHRFLKELFLQLFISSQMSTPLISTNPKDVPTTRNRGALEQIFIKATKIETLAMGLVYFLSEAFRDADDESTSKLLKWASGVAKDTLRTGLDVIPTL